MILKLSQWQPLIEGAEDAQLDLGCGHVPGFPFPGEIGTSFVMCHRTSAPAPLNGIRDLQIGDVIMTVDQNGVQTSFEVVEEYRVIPNYDVSFLWDKHEGSNLVLMACARDSEGNPGLGKGDPHASDFRVLVRLKRIS